MDDYLCHYYYGRGLSLRDTLCAIGLSLRDTASALRYLLRKYALRGHFLYTVLTCRIGVYSPVPVSFVANSNELFKSGGLI